MIRNGKIQNSQRKYWVEERVKAMKQFELIENYFFCTVELLDINVYKHRVLGKLNVIINSLRKMEQDKFILHSACPINYLMQYSEQCCTFIRKQ